jgi:hypothetical protein
VAEIAGLKLIVPSSVSSTGTGNSSSVSASGKITFSSCSTVSVNDVFSSTHDNYLIVSDNVLNTGDAILYIRLRSSGSDASGTNYVYQRLRATSTTVSGVRGTTVSTGFVGSVSATARSGFHCYMYGPNLAQPTAYRGVNVWGQNSASIDDYAVTHSLSTAYTGFTLLTTNDLFSGSMTVYGLSQ